MSKTSNRGRTPTKLSLTATISVAILLGGVLAAVGFVNYRLWISPYGPIFPTAEQTKPTSDVWKPPAPISVYENPPPRPSEAAMRLLRKQMENEPGQLVFPARRQHSTDDLIAAVDKAFRRGG